MNYNSGFNFNELMNDDKTRARVILAFYAVLIISIIILVRTSPSVSNNTNKAKNNTNTNAVNETEDPETSPYADDDMEHTEAEEKDPNSLYNRFSFLRLHNYAYIMEIDFGHKIKYEGIRFDNKWKFSTENSLNSDKYEYQIKNDEIYVLLNGTYEEVELPALFIDYFDLKTLYDILRASTAIETKENEVTYVITNSDLAEYIIDEYIVNVNMDDEIMNTIKVTLNNNKISSIDMNLTNFINKDDDYEKLIISLNYDKFAQISDFNVDF